ncbi:MAG: hypothetical protein M3N22_08650 [Acidobacteriota bacterium]|nr:hypothetical protein [Acidobacteriota bacterium]
MKILVTYAVEAEFAPWRTLRNMEKITVGGVAAHRAQVGSATVDFVATGIGMNNAHRAANATISGEYSFCIVSGFAGALTPSCKVGEVVIPATVQQPGSSHSVLTASSLLMDAGRDSAKRIQTLLTTDHLVSSAQEKQRLSSLGEAVDMESVEILGVARAKNVPAIAIRVISDAFDGNLPAHLDTLVDAKGNVKIGGIVRYIAKNPRVLPALLRLGRDSKTAATALANFLEAYIKKLAVSTRPPELQEAAAR